MVFQKCFKCGETQFIHARGCCNACYKKYFWKQRSAKCKRCNRVLPLHAKGLCPSCYNSVFCLDKNKAWNQKNKYDLEITLYKKITEKCVICDFNKVVDLHHFDYNQKNNSESNLVGLCPNHHKMLHDSRYQKEIIDLLKEKGFLVKEDEKLNFKL